LEVELVRRRELGVALRLDQLQVRKPAAQREQARAREAADQECAPVEDALTLVDFLEEDRRFSHPGALTGTARRRLRTCPSADSRRGRGRRWPDTARRPRRSSASTCRRA